MNNRFVSAILGMICVFAVHYSAYSRTFTVNQSDPVASDNNQGTAESPYRTIAPAAEGAGPGDTVIVHAGIYRERVAPAREGEAGRPVVYMAAPGEEVVLRGSIVWQPEWSQHDSCGGAFCAYLDNEMFGDFNPFHTRLARAGDIQGRSDADRLTLGQIFIDGARYEEVPYIHELLQEPGTWYHDSASDIITVHFQSLHNPGRSIIEITVEKQVFAPYKRGLGYIHVHGFTMEHAANQFPSGFYNDDGSGYNQNGVLGCRSGHHWRVEKNTVRFGKNIGIDCGYEGESSDEPEPSPPRSATGYHSIRHNRVCDNGACGIAGARGPYTSIVGNIVERNNYLLHTAPENGGIKVHGFTEGIIEGNLVRDNNASGIWLDAGFTRAKVLNNILVNNIGHGLLIELGGGPCLAANNVEAYTRMGTGTSSTGGDGFSGQDANRVTLAHNLSYFNARFGLFSCTITGRRGGSCTGWEAHNNILLDNGGSDLRFINTPLTTGAVSGNITTPGNFLQTELGGVHYDTLMTVLNFDTAQMIVEINIRDTVFAGSYERIAGVDTDFSGNPLPQNPLPGPFQTLVPGDNTIHLQIDSIFAAVPGLPANIQHPAIRRTIPENNEYTLAVLAGTAHLPAAPVHAKRLQLFTVSGRMILGAPVDDGVPEVPPARSIMHSVVLVRWVYSP
ncbi:MAG: hypothetical protein GF350_11785 [Chitinivibrionales bacterium]|nr:hypothetical protein [Chitinivibrionales bacterium]